LKKYGYDCEKDLDVFIGQVDVKARLELIDEIVEAFIRENMRWPNFVDVASRMPDYAGVEPRDAGLFLAAWFKNNKIDPESRKISKGIVTIAAKIEFLKKTAVDLKARLGRMPTADEIVRRIPDEFDIPKDAKKFEYWATSVKTSLSELGIAPSAPAVSRSCNIIRKIVPADDSAAEMIDSLGLTRSDRVLNIGQADKHWELVACAVVGALVDVVPYMTNQEGLKARLVRIIEEVRSKITEKGGEDLLGYRIDTDNYWKAIQDGNLPKRQYSHLLSLDIPDGSKMVGGKSVIVPALLESLRDDAIMLLSFRAGKADKDVTSFIRTGDKLGYDIKVASKIKNETPGIVYKLTVHRREKPRIKPAPAADESNSAIDVQTKVARAAAAVDSMAKKTISNTSYDAVPLKPLVNSLSETGKAARELKGAARLSIAIPVNEFKSMPDFRLAMASLACVGESTKIDIVVTGASDEDVAVIEGLNESAMKKSLKIPANVEISAVTEDEIKDYAKTYTRDIADVKVRNAVIKDIMLDRVKSSGSGLGNGQYLAVVTDPVSKDDAARLKEELAGYMSGELSENVSIRIQVSPSGCEVMSMTAIISDWLKDIKAKSTSGIGITLPKLVSPAEMMKQLADSLAAMWQVVASA
jgi:hypothetical protein